ncbi:hypothetical protein D1007_16837 [Hordeum vulgare]|uniref:Predicted protein n=1 Tax=Hordeum vulgare subsp. vulgare TaxID=112509 RepID=F2DVU8_HORVV|nr:uncharacterized protein LOC123425208 [Hordeum vulgare subsp. vulgare]KAE8806971.1 hypothetical protein D1007_16837 [Hordeum vulgare]KAI5008101.1 hypothetical protein ZWY2020_009149 [Hordeum vulgare]BAJ99219.1 predicted protein [Hordeum vulgare subsp. vulgare]
MDFDFDCAAASPGGQWMGETASRRRQRRLSSSAYLTPAFDAVAAGQGGISPSSYSSGGLDLGFDASLLRLRRTCFSANAELDSRRLLYSPQSPPPQQQARTRRMHAMADHEAAYLYASKRQAGGLTGAPGFPELKHTFSNFRSPDGAVILGNKLDLMSTPKPGATPSAQMMAAAAQPTEEEDDLIAEALYGRSGRRRLPIFREICPE